jgi:hypothetical protein
MSLVDSLDSVVMLYSYSGFIESSKRFRIIERVASDMPRTIGVEANQNKCEEQSGGVVEVEELSDEAKEAEKTSGGANEAEEPASSQSDAEQQNISRTQALKQSATSSLGLILTFMSIVIAFR